MKKIISCLSVCLACCALFYIFYTPNTSKGNREIQRISSVYIHSDYPTAASIDAMEAASEYIVVGQYTAYDSSWNMARNPLTPEVEDTDHYTEGRLYRFQVDRVLRGELESDEILINLRYSETVTAVESNAVVDHDGRIVKAATQENTLSFVAHDPLFIEPELGVTYILFLSKNAETGHFYSAVEPFSIKDNQGMAVLQSNLIDHDDFTEQVSIDSQRVIEVKHDSVRIENFIGKATFGEIVEGINRSAP